MSALEGYGRRDSVVCWICNFLLNHFATPRYRAMVGGSIRYGLLAAASKCQQGDAAGGVYSATPESSQK